MVVALIKNTVEVSLIDKICRAKSFEMYFLVWTEGKWESGTWVLRGIIFFRIRETQAYTNLRGIRKFLTEKREKKGKLIGQDSERDEKCWTLESFIERGPLDIKTLGNF